ncbi:MAG: hypothetical protein IJU34_09985 [Bacteroidales bacterium]|nr:hypothetical protein [Bacteroidales bacterium]
MKKSLYLGLAALLLPALVACKGKGQQAAQFAWQDEDIVAVAFLGYYDSFGEFEQSPSYPRLTKTFPQIVEAKQVDTEPGREIYLVVPRDPMSTLAVNEAGSYIPEDGPAVFYRSEEGRPILLLNNWEEPNTQIVCTDNQGRSVTYSPALDRKSGKLRKAAQQGVRDISLPLPEPLKGYTEFDYGEDFDGNNLGIRVRLEAGAPVLTISYAPLANIGFDEDNFRLNDGENTIYGINGVCKGVFLGTIGQDYNPVICALMEDGTVKMCSVFYAVHHGGPELSGVLPGFKDVTGFESGGGGPWKDEESGETFYEYETIYALDARGGRTEIPYFVNYGTYYSKDERYIYEATLSPDWNYNLVCISRDEYAPQEGYAGWFFEKEAGDSVQKFSFSRYSRMNMGDEGFEYDYKPLSGTFTAAERGLSYEISLAGSDAFPSGLTFQDERLLEKSIYDD